jgi:Ion channel
MAAFWTSALGLLIVCWTLREIFRDLFQPSGTGTLSSFLGKQIFELSKRFRPLMSVAGPLSVVVVIACWAILVAAGFALIYWARYPSAFNGTGGDKQDAFGRFWTVLYFSLSTMTTVGSGQLAPRSSWIRIIAALESLIGISLLTASITWIVLIYPALGRMRELARRATTLVKAQKKIGVDLISDDVQGLLGDLAQSVIRTRVDFIHYPLIYYFHADTEGTSLADSLRQLGHLAERASEDKRAEAVRLAAAVLNMALADVATVLNDKFVQVKDPKDPEEVFAAVGRNHLESEHIH